LANQKLKLYQVILQKKGAWMKILPRFKIQYYEKPLQMYATSLVIASFLTMNFNNYKTQILVAPKRLFVIKNLIL